MRSKALAHANIALVKYWGKRDVVLNLPDVGSISITLDSLRSETEVVFQEDLNEDRFILNNKEASEKEIKRVSAFLDLVRAAAGLSYHAEVISENNFPTSAGLASSASAFAALSLAAVKAAGLNYDNKELSILARRGSGSAARSIFGGFVEMYKGGKSDGSGAYAEQIAAPEHWDIRVLIAITSVEAKKTGSTDGMNLSKLTSPYYKAWVESSAEDLSAMREAVINRDFEKTAEIAEFSCLKMHALAMASNPGLIYWNPTTVKLIHEVKSLRKQGYPLFFTIDAGPQVKIITLPEYAVKIENYIAAIPGVEKVISTGLGGGAELLEAAR